MFRALKVKSRPQFDSDALESHLDEAERVTLEHETFDAAADFL